MNYFSIHLIYYRYEKNENKFPRRCAPPPYAPPISRTSRNKNLLNINFDKIDNLKKKQILIKKFLFE